MNRVLTDSGKSGNLKKSGNLAILESSGKSEEILRYLRETEFSGQSLYQLKQSVHL
jgi:hypothetical protein